MSRQLEEKIKQAAVSTGSHELDEMTLTPIVGLYPRVESVSPSDRIVQKVSIHLG